MLSRETQRGGWKFTCGALLALASVPALALLIQGEHMWAALARPPTAATGFAGFAEYAGAAQAFDPFNGPLLRSVAPQVAAILLLLLLAARLAAILARAGGAARGAEEQRGAESGASVIEFALVLPLLLIILLLVLQIALLVQAKFMVNYAAFCAARSAVVTIPAKIYSQRTGRYEKPNTLQLNSPLSPKMNIIRRAAALPCVAISPVLNPTVWSRTGTSIADTAYAGTFARMGLLFPFEAEGRLVPLELFKRASYAYDDENTTVEVIREGGQAGQGGTVIVNGQIVTQSRDLGDHELITVRVTFRYYLTAPGVNRMLGEPYRPGLLGFFLGTGFYYPISEQYTLPLEGERLFPPDQEPRDQREVETEFYD